MRRIQFTDEERSAIAKERFYHPNPRVQRRMEILWLKQHGDRLQEPGHFLAAQRFGEPSGALHGHAQVEWLAEHLAVEEAEASQLLVAGAGGQLALRDEQMQIVAHLLEAYLLGRAALVGGQSGDGSDIGFDRFGGLALQLKFANHTLAQRGHPGSSLFGGTEVEK